MRKKDPEFPKDVRVNFTVTNDTITSRVGLINKRWFKMKKIMTWVIIAKEIWTKQIRKQTSDNLEKIMKIELSEKAANSIVEMVQMKSFGEEIRILGANSDRIEDSKSIKLYKSDPFLDSDGLLRVGGRLGKSCLSHSEAHPLALSKQTNTSEAIIRWCHGNVAHGGRVMALKNLRQNVSIIVNYVTSLVYKKWQIYLKLDTLKYHHLHTMGLICSDHTPSEKGDVTSKDTVPYLRDSQLEQFTLK